VYDSITDKKKKPTDILLLNANEQYGICFKMCIYFV